MNALTRPKLVVYLSAIFLAGGVAGGFVGYHWRGEHRPQFSRPTPDQMIGFLRGKLAEEVGVTDEQWVEIGPIITNTVREVGACDARNRESIGELIARSDAQIMDKLKPEQRPRMQKMLDERQKHGHGGHGKEKKQASP